MAQPISGALRRAIVEGRKQGQTLMTLSTTHQVGYTTVQALCKRYASEGEEGLKPRYDRCGKKRRDAGKDLVYRAVRCYKRWHPQWGAEKIRAELLLARPSLEIPPTRTLYKWFSYEGRGGARNKVPRQATAWAKSAHEVWQIDAKEEMQTQDGVRCCWLNIKDEYTGAVIEPWVFPLQEDL